MQAGLDKCHVFYPYPQVIQLSFDSVKSNVEDKWPIMVGASAGDKNHAVTLYGYGSNYVYLWNPGNSKSQLVEYSENGTVFPYNNLSYVWQRSISRYQ